MAVGTEIVFNCPEGYFFEHDIYAPTRQKMRCTDDGTFKQPEEWFKCVARKSHSSLWGMLEFFLLRSLTSSIPISTLNFTLCLYSARQNRR